jgi:hypothetical protein
VRREPKGQTFPAVQLSPGMPAIADASSILAPLKDTTTKVSSSQKIEEDKLKHVLELAVMFRNNCLLCWYQSNSLQPYFAYGCLTNICGMNQAWMSFKQRLKFPKNNFERMI